MRAEAGCRRARLGPVPCPALFKGPNMLSRCGVGAVLCLLVMAGCRGPLRHSLPEERVLQSNEYMLTADIHVPQGNGPAGCGAQALGAAMGRLDPAR